MTRKRWKSEMHVPHVHPLVWPRYIPRTEGRLRQPNPYRIQPTEAMSELKNELRMWGATSATWSTDSVPVGDGINIRLVHGDPGVCVRWTCPQGTWELASDTYQTLFANLISIARQISAIRRLRKSPSPADKKKSAKQWWTLVQAVETNRGPRITSTHLRALIAQSARYTGPREVPTVLFTGDQ